MQVTQIRITHKIVLLEEDMLLIWEFNQSAMSHLSEGQKYILQSYENLGYNTFRAKILHWSFNFEFLDLAPQNVFIDCNKYVISNMGISYKGSKFLKSETPKQAQLVLCAITKSIQMIVLESGQLKDNIYYNQFLTSRSEDEIRQIQRFIKKQFNSIANVEKPFERYKTILLILSYF